MSNILDQHTLENYNSDINKSLEKIRVLKEVVSDINKEIESKKDAYTKIINKMCIHTSPIYITNNHNYHSALKLANNKKQNVMNTSLFDSDEINSIEVFRLCPKSLKLVPINLDSDNEFYSVPIKTIQIDDNKYLVDDNFCSINIVETMKFSTLTLDEDNENIVKIKYNILNPTKGNVKIGWICFYVKYLNKIIQEIG